MKLKLEISKSCTMLLENAQNKIKTQRYWLQRINIVDLNKNL